MRINYYKFPDSVLADVRYKNGAEFLDGTCAVCPERWEGDDPLLSADCDRKENSDGEACGGCMDCVHRICTDSEYEIAGIKVSAAKALLAEFGGAAWTCHYERDGGLFETTPITPKGNNSRFKYNRHL